MRVIWPIAVITFKEGIRSRALYGIGLLALMMILANFLISSMIMQDVGKVAVDIALSTISFSGLLIILFVGINLMAKDLDRHTIYMVLSRPISRAQYVVGKFLGLVLLLIVVITLIGFLSLTSLGVLKLLYANYFGRFQWSLVLLATFLLTMSLILLLALSLLFASFSSTSFVVLVLTIITYFIGHSLADVKSLVESPGVVGIKVSPLTTNIVKFAYYLFPNLSFFDIKTFAAHGLSVGVDYVLWVVLYALVYIILTVAIASAVFCKREFP